MAEVWRLKHGLVPFSSAFLHRAQAASRWLATMVNSSTGDAPNIGANDGARLLPLTDTAYRDFRPSVQLATVLFSGERAYSGTGEWDLPLHWLNVDIPEEVASTPDSRLFDDGGYAVLKQGRCFVLLRYPRFRFRPSQADALHLDLWRDGACLLGDAGSYSYNTAVRWLSYFPGTASHNTVQFDGRDQMPRLSRFLFGDWLRTSAVEPLKSQVQSQECGASYTDARGATHRRHVAVNDNHLTITDELSGFIKTAVLRWRLQPGEWVVQESRLRTESSGYRSMAA